MTLTTEVLVQDGVDPTLADFFDEACEDKGVQDPTALTVEAHESAVHDNKVVITAEVDQSDQEQMNVASALLKAFRVSGKLGDGSVQVLPLIPPQEQRPIGFRAYVDKNTYTQLRQTVPVRPLGHISLQ